jgi:vitamin B12/bleomycin/antimicrobial peptide transport system ATP-binding/permease protein
MKWDQEIVNSALWLAQAYAITLVVFFATAVGVLRSTRWGRQFQAITGDYFSPRRSLRPLLGVALMLLLVLAGVRMNVLFSNWYNGFYSGMQALDAASFWFHMRLFGVLAALHVVRALVNAWVRGAFGIHWREWLNERLVTGWLGRQGYYLGRYVQPGVDNPDQRIQQDAPALVTSTLTLALGLVSAVVSMIEFTGILWGLSAPLELFGQVLPRAMVFLVYLYVLTATVFAVAIGRPLIQLNFLQEQFGATYRYLLVRLREYGESIALYRGEKVEQRGLLAGFASVIANAWALLKRSLMFDGYNLGISQLAVVFPFLIQAPRMFAGQIKLGDVMQTGEAFGQVQDALSFFRTSYDSFAGYQAVLNRLSGFNDNLQAAAALSLPRLAGNPAALVVRDLTVRRPDGQLLSKGLDFRVPAGSALLIRGPSGSGKTTLLRALAGLWPYAEGHAERPEGTACLFLSQKPYLPVGSLRTALAYPAEQVETARAEAILAQVQLGHLAGQLDVEQDWSQVLSPGEQQRLAFGRVLAAQPAIVFLDEATSATDSGLEHSLYALLRRELPQAIVVSVGHRETLLAFHDQALSLQRDGTWRLEALARG